MLEIPDACPTSFAGTDEVDADDAGPLARPRPIEIATNAGMNSTYSQSASTNARAANPAAAAAKPSRTAARDPILTAIGVMNGVMAIMTAAAGNVAKPASRADIPNPAGSWKYR